MTPIQDADESHVAADFLRGDPAALRAVDAWVEAVLRRFPSVAASEPEDVRQEVRIRVFRNLSRGVFDGRSSLRTYVHRIAMNVCIDCVRRANRRPACDDKTIAEDDLGGARDGAAADAVIAGDLVAKILAGLDVEERRLVQMVFEWHDSYAEVARALGVPEGTVKSRMARCKERMVERYKSLTRSGKGPP